MNLFRKVVFLLLIILSHKSFSQVSYNSAVKNSFDSVFTKLDPRLVKMVNNPENKIRGVALLTGFTLDTLNKQDIITSAPSKSNAFSGYQPEKILFPDVMIGRAKAKGDSVVILISPWFMQGESIKHIVHGSNNASFYQLWNREDKMFQVANKPQADNPKVNAIAKMVLSDNKFSPGKIIYGSVNFVSDEYLQIQAPGFREGKMKLRVLYNYVFKFFILKDDGLSAESEMN